MVKYHLGQQWSKYEGLVDTNLKKGNFVHFIYTTLLKGQLPIEFLWFFYFFYIYFYGQTIFNVNKCHITETLETKYCESGMCNLFHML